MNESNAREYTGHCLCGTVRLAATTSPDGVHACHCSQCRRWSGGPLPCVEAQVRWLEGAQDIVWYGSSDWAERGFCRHCGSTLAYRLKENGMTMVAVGLFDDPAGLSLHGEIFVDSEPMDLRFAGDHERLTAAEFMARIGAG